MTLRAVHVLPAIGQQASGPSYSVPRLCRALAQAGVDTALHVLARGGVEDWADLTIYQHPEWSLLSSRLGISPDMRRSLRLEARNGASVLHNHSLWMMPNVYPGYAVTGTHCRLVTSPRGVLDAWARRRSKWRKLAMWALLQRQTLERTDCFHATSDSEYESIRAVSSRVPVAIIPNGVDIPRISQMARPVQRRVVFLGRVHPKKGVDILLRAWSSTWRRFPDCELHIIGPNDGGYEGRMRELATELGTERVKFRGPVFGNDRWVELAAASVFVLPTHAENFGLAVAEALASGAPAIVTRGAPWRGLETERCGWWIEQGVDSLTEALGHALALPSEELSAMGARGRRWVERDFSWQPIGEKMARTYEWLTHGGTTPEWVKVA